MAVLNRRSVNEFRPRREKTYIVCTGYQCPIALTCKRYIKPGSLKRMLASSGKSGENLMLQSPPTNSNKKCHNYIASF